jgi:hypothetical protein
MEDCEIIAGAYIKVNEKLHVDCDFVLHTSNCHGSDTESAISNDNTVTCIPVARQWVSKYIPQKRMCRTIGHLLLGN